MDDGTPLGRGNARERAKSNAGQACRECRRRKGRCDGKVPVCSICQRYNRHCLYDKHSRSALTRKHLTEVEERLERAEEVLRGLFSESELNKVLTDGLSPNHEVYTRLSTRQTEPVTYGAGDETGSRDTRPPEENPGIAADVSSPLTEIVPGFGDDDFEWDERQTSWDFGNSGLEPHEYEHDGEGDIPRLTDGMATLAVGDSNAGFLGSVSGAALLRLMSHGPDTQAAGNAHTDHNQFTTHHHRDAGMTEYWHHSQPLLNRAMVDMLVDAYFALYHPTFPVLHEGIFRQHYQTLDAQKSGTWHTLANLVATLGSFVSSSCTDSTHMSLFNSVKSQLSIDLLEVGSLGLVQAFSMAANYLQKRNLPNSGYAFGGVALRMAISLGLHKELHSWQTTPLKKEIRRRVWWSLCVLDVGATTTYGRPLNWPQVGVDANFPKNIHEQDLTTDDANVPKESSEATIYVYITTQSQYHLRTIQIYNRLISHPAPSASEMIALDDEHVGGWLKALPPYYNDRDLPLPQEQLLGHSISRWRSRLLRIIMYRPFMLRWVQDSTEHKESMPMNQSASAQDLRSEDKATYRCFKAAEECIGLLCRFWMAATHTRLAAWYVLYFLLQATLIPVHSLRRRPSHADAASWRSQISMALSVIDAMHNINPSAPKCRDIIIRLCGKYLGNIDGNDNLLLTRTMSGTEDFKATQSGPWMNEVDTAIDNYDAFVERLTQPFATSNTPQLQQYGPSSFNAIPGWGVDSGSQDAWDWGSML